MKISEIEKELLEKGKNSIVGIDECARGNLAGPVFAAGVIMRTRDIPSEFSDIMDSKKLKHQRILELSQYIRNNHIWNLSLATSREIDKHNILNATKLAMYRVLKKFKMQHKQIDFVLVDGNMKFSDKIIPDNKYKSIVRGDGKILAISAASIVAKAAQLNYMLYLDQKYPDYGFCRHNGYGTKEHCKSIIKHGVLNGIHRKTFKRVKEYVTNN